METELCSRSMGWNQGGQKSSWSAVENPVLGYTLCRGEVSVDRTAQRCSGLETVRSGYLGPEKYAPPQTQALPKGRQTLTS